MRDFSKALIRFSVAMPLLGVQQVVNAVRDPSQSLNEAEEALIALSECAEQQLGVSTEGPIRSSEDFNKQKAQPKPMPECVPAMVFRYVRVPDKLVAGYFDVYGDQILAPSGAGSEATALPVSIVIDLSPPAPIYHLWGIFSEPLKPGQQGVMVFLNLPGDLPLAGAFTEWDHGQNVPVLADDSLLTIISVQRKAGIGRIVGRNDSSRDVRIAAGIVVGALATIGGP